MSAPTKPKKATSKAKRSVVGPQVEGEIDFDALVEQVQADPDAPVEIGKRGKSGDGLKMVLVFTSRGREFYMPKEPPVMLVINFMRDLRKYGRDGAVENMAFEFLGEDAVREMGSNPEVEPEDVAEIFTRVGNRFFESATYKKIADAAGNSRRG